MPLQLPAGHDAVLCQTVRMKYSDNGGGAAGTYTASIDLPGDAILLDVILHAVTAWDSGTSATGIVGDGTDPNGIYDAINLKITDLVAAESISSALAGGKAGVDIAASQFNRRALSTFRTITLSNTTVGSTTAGETWLIVLYAITAGPTIRSSTFVAT